MTGEAKYAKPSKVGKHLRHSPVAYRQPFFDSVGLSTIPP